MPGWGDITVKGKKFEVFVNQEGEFTAQYEGEFVRKDTLKKLKDALSTLLGASPLNIPCYILTESYRETISIVKAKVVSVHSSNGNLIIEKDGKREQNSSYGAVFLNDKTDVQEVKRLHVEKRAAEQAYADYIAKYRIDPRKIKEGLNKEAAGGQKA